MSGHPIGPGKCAKGKKEPLNRHQIIIVSIFQRFRSLAHSPIRPLSSFPWPAVLRQSVRFSRLRLLLRFRRRPRRHHLLEVEEK